MNQNRAIVTGSAGYIGGHMAKKLLDLGWTVLGYDNQISSTGENSTVLEKMSNYIDLKFADQLNNRDNCDVLFHFAALKSVPDSQAEPAKYWHNNIGVLYEAIGLAKKWNIKHFVFSSSCSVLGQKTGPVTEIDTTNPQSVYAQTKLVSEQILEQWSKETGIKVTILRYFNPIGVADGLSDNHFNSTNLIPSIAFKILANQPIQIYGHDWPTSDGTCIRDYIDINDLIDAHLSVLDLNHQNTEIFNVGTGRGVSVLELVDTIIDILGKGKFEFKNRRDGDIAQIWANPEKIQKIGWTAKTGLKDSLISHLKYYKLI